MRRIHLHLFKRPLRSAPLSGAAFTKARDDLHRALGPLCLESSRLEPGQRERLSGNLFPGCAALVQSVAEGLQQAPPCFPDVPLDGAVLERAQDEASGALLLHRSLRALAELVYDHYVAQQAACSVSAIAVLRQIQGVASAPFSSPRERLVREEAVRDALCIHRERIQRARRALLAKNRAGRKAQQALKRDAPRAEP